MVAKLLWLAFIIGLVLNAVEIIRLRYWTHQRDKALNALLEALADYEYEVERAKKLS